MLYRRAKSLVAYWDGGLAVRNYARGRQTIRLGSDALAVLDALDAWQSEADLRDRLPGPFGEPFAAVLERLIDTGMVECATSPPHPVEEALEAWADWGP